MPKADKAAWLVKSDTVKIQGWFASTSRRSFLKAIAVGGSFLENNTLIIGTEQAKAFWNDEEILSSLPSEYHNELMSALYHSDVQLVQDPTRKALAPGFDIHLPLDVELFVNRGKNGLAMRLVMPQIEEGVDGECGNFNGAVEDDSPSLIEERLRGVEVNNSEMLFGKQFTQ